MHPAASQAGKAEGFRRGQSAGYRQGRCVAALARVAGSPEPKPFWNIKLLYVTAEFGVCYNAIDNGIIESLQGMVRELITANVEQPLAEICRERRPDVVLVLNSMDDGVARQMDDIRSMGIRTAIWHCDDPYYSDVSLERSIHYDVVFTHEKSCVPAYREAGCPRVFHLPLGMNPRVFTPKQVPPMYETDICFIGNAFWNRVELFDKLAPYLAGKRVMIAGLWWQRLDHYTKLSKMIRSGAWMHFEETARYYNGAKLVINLHRRHDDESINMNSRRLPSLSINPRTYEISACGTLQLTDAREELPDQYTPGRELVTYDSAEHLMQIMEYYLRHEKERIDIAMQGLARTLRDHTFDKRMAVLLRTVMEAM
ncbi:CgeB family protein [Paenibacillus sp. y28]|uniref:CgeB family protein n=1 Tax=Paenibacillus sp. y28 TaxID=3129110 RepID=UPI003017AD1A